jgi:acetylornithine deacetylase/succinyl-diaminopimelate desuccinylase-like protein
MAKALGTKARGRIGLAAGLWAAALPGTALAANTAHAAHTDAAANAAETARAKEVLMRSIGFETSEGKGQVPALAAYYASILKQAGFADGDIVITPMGETATLAATIKGSDPKLKPLLVNGHMDVVAANKADWTRDPFVAVEENGYIFGRGADDNKYDVAMMVSTFAKLKAEGFRPKRTLILALTGDEETHMRTAKAMAETYKNSEMVLNGDGGGGVFDDEWKPVVYTIQAGEKTYADFDLTFTDPGGHSSQPTPTNPIYRLARALDRLAAYQFAPMSNELTRASLTAQAKKTEGEVGKAMARYAADPKDMEAAAILSAQPDQVGKVRTTCVATTAQAGHALNALPQRASVNINCRIFPGVSIETVKAELTKVIADDGGTLSVVDDPTASDASPLRKDLMAAVTKAVHARYPGLEIVPGMSTGATDSLYFRAQGIPSYGVATLFSKPNDSFAHGLNERAPVAGIGASLDQWHMMITALAK